MQLAGDTGNRVDALLKVKYKNMKVALLSDPDGGGRPRCNIDWKSTETKPYLGPKDS